MYILYRLIRSKISKKIVDKKFVEDAISTIDEAHEIAQANGTGEYVVASIRRSPGDRIVERFRVGSPVFESTCR